jgi:predicted nucleic acid-binding protein
VTGRCFVVNASPLILLAKIEALELLAELAEEIAVPAAVRAEVSAGPRTSAPLRRFLRQRALRREADAPVPEEIAGWDLGAGESQVLRFAVANPGWEAVLDDLEARRCARSLDVPLTGTLGIILRAKQAGQVKAARPMVEALVQRGAFLSRDLIEAALASVGE